MSVNVTVIVNRDGDESRVDISRTDATPPTWDNTSTSSVTVIGAVSTAVQRALAGHGVAVAVGIDEVSS